MPNYCSRRNNSFRLLARRAFSIAIFHLHYRPQGNVMFSEACVIMFTGGGGGVGRPPDRDPHLERDPLDGDPQH